MKSSKSVNCKTPLKCDIRKGISAAWYQVFEAKGIFLSQFSSFKIYEMRLNKDNLKLCQNDSTEYLSLRSRYSVMIESA